jgi:alpha-glucosidase
MRIPFFLLILGLLISCSGFKKNKWTLSSPDKHTSITVQLLDRNGDGQMRLYYTVSIGADSQAVQVLQPSPLGISVDDEEFVDGLTYQAESAVTRVDEEYTMTTGKRRQWQVRGFEQTLIFRNPHGSTLELILRAYSDGVAFRYRLPDKDDRPHIMKEEVTGFQVPNSGTAFMQPYDEPAMYTPAYEAFYQKNLAIGTSSPNKAGWCFPALFNIANRWLLITEAGLDRSYCGCRLAQDALDGLYRLRFPDSAEGNHTGEVNPRSTLPWLTPWRVLVVGESPAAVLETGLVTHLSAPSTIHDTAWIAPGRVSWSWWSDQPSPRNEATLRRFVDLASEMGWEYSLVDANWNEMAAEVIPDLVSYARSKNVGILLWYNSGGPHNNVTEAPRDRMFERERRRREMAWLERIGVKGIKVDFFQSDKQNVMQLYQDILQDARDFHIMVNFHGCTLPRGWQRTYPNLMSMEGVKGAENYIFEPAYPVAAPWINTVLVFTRNAVGSMDYTPVTFSDNNNPHLTTWGHELALSVVFESGWLHFADRVPAYTKATAATQTFLKQVPVAWDDTRYIAGSPGTYVVLARRRGEDWYFAGINGQNVSQTVQFDFSLLGPGRFQALKIGDEESPRHLVDDSQIIRQEDKVQLNMLPYGGFVIQAKRIPS